MEEDYTPGTFVVNTTITKYIHSQSGLRVSLGLAETLSAMVKATIDEGIIRARKTRRHTLMIKDL